MNKGGKEARRLFDGIYSDFISRISKAKVNRRRQAQADGKHRQSGLFADVGIYVWMPRLPCWIKGKRKFRKPFFENGSFGVVRSRLAFRHFMEPELIFEAMERLLQPSGKHVI